MITNNDIKALQRRMDQARKNASSCSAFAAANPSQAGYWRNLAAQVNLLADEIEEQVLRMQYRKKQEPAIGNVLRFSDYQKVA